MKHLSLVSQWAARLALFTLVLGAAFGLAATDGGHTIGVCVDWLVGFTGHLDGLASGMASGAASGAATALVGGALATLPEEVRKKLPAGVGEAFETLDKNLNTIFTKYEPAIEELKANQQGFADVAEKVDKASVDNARLIDEAKAELSKAIQEHQEETNKELDALRRRAQGPRTMEGKEVKSAGQGLAESIETAKDREGNPFGAGSRGRVVFTFDDWKRHEVAVNLQKAVTISDNAVYVPQYLPGVVGPAQRGLRVRDLLPVVRTSQNTIYFVKETAVTDNAGMQSALGAAKGESSFTFASDSETVKTVAHFVKVATQILDDVPGLQGYIDSRMLFLLEQEEEDQLLVGDGTGQNLNGIQTQATDYDGSILTELGTEAVQDLDRIRAMIAQVQNAEYPPTGIVLTPFNWAGLELLKDSQERYLFAAPQDAAGPRLWGLPVVATTAQTEGEVLVGAFALGAMLWDRQMAAIAISTEDEDNFQKNLATIRAEKRIALTVFRTAAFVNGTISGVVT